MALIIAKEDDIVVTYREAEELRKKYTQYERQHEYDHATFEQFVVITRLALTHSHTIFFPTQELNAHPCYPPYRPEVGSAGAFGTEGTICGVAQ